MPIAVPKSFICRTTAETKAINTAMGTRTKTLKRKPAAAPINALVNSKTGTIGPCFDAAPVVELVPVIGFAALPSQLVTKKL